MAFILNIETATTVCSVSLSENGSVIAHKEINQGYTHAENLTVFIQDVCKEAQFDIKKIDVIAVSKGPGSYTGLRIGVSTAKGICYALNKPLIAISTLQAMAMSEQWLQYKNTSTVLCPMIDARRMEVYCALYTAAGDELKPSSAKIIDENSFDDELKKHPILFFGDGAEKCKPLLGDRPNAVFVPNVFPSAKNMCMLSQKAFEQKQFENTAYFEPLYLKEFGVAI